MMDVIEIKKDKIIVQLAFVLKKTDTAYVGRIPSFDLPFTSPSKEKAAEIASGLIKALLTKWTRTGNMDLLKKKLEKFHVSLESQSRFEHSAPERSNHLYAELHVV
jgi:hypothetical protein